MADPGSVSRLFNRKGVVVLNKAQDGKDVDEDTVLEATLDAGAEEVNDLGEAWQVIAEASDVVTVRSALQDAGIDYESADVEFVASLEIPVADAATAGKVMRLVDAIDDLDDVQNVFSNADIPVEVLEELDAG
jgi:transcriptional/translational regulatory protein YebC/TACO1